MSGKGSPSMQLMMQQVPLHTKWVKKREKEFGKGEAPGDGKLMDEAMSGGTEPGIGSSQGLEPAAERRASIETGMDLDGIMGLPRTSPLAAFGSGEFVFNIDPRVWIIADLDDKIASKMRDNAKISQKLRIDPQALADAVTAILESNIKKATQRPIHHGSSVYIEKYVGPFNPFRSL